jgi:hypothetical protein
MFFRRFDLSVHLREPACTDLYILIDLAITFLLENPPIPDLGILIIKNLPSTTLYIQAILAEEASSMKVI